MSPRCSDSVDMRPSVLPTTRATLARGRQEGPCASRVQAVSCYDGLVRTSDWAILVCVDSKTGRVMGFARDERGAVCVGESEYFHLWVFPLPPIAPLPSQALPTKKKLTTPQPQQCIWWTPTRPPPALAPWPPTGSCATSSEPPFRSSRSRCILGWASAGPRHCWLL